MKFFKFIFSLFGKKEKKPDYVFPHSVVTDYPIKLHELNRPNFKASEFWYSNTAEENDIDNTPKEQYILFNLMKTADMIQHFHYFVQTKFPDKKVKIIITSGYRNDATNKLVGGSPTSAHLTGLAIDIKITINNISIEAEKIAILYHESQMTFDQLLIEKTICHIGYKDNDRENRKEISIATRNKMNKWKLKPYKI